MEAPILRFLNCMQSLTFESAAASLALYVIPALPVRRDVLTTMPDIHEGPSAWHDKVPLPHR